MACSAALADTRASGAHRVRAAEGRDMPVAEAPGRDFFFERGRRLTGKRPAGRGAAATPPAPAAPAAPVPAPAAVVARPPDRADTVGDTATPLAPGAARRSAEADMAAGIEVGDETAVLAHALYNKRLFQNGADTSIVVHCTRLDKIAFTESLRPAAAASSADGPNDVRTLPLKSGSRGRDRERREVVGGREEEPFGDSPIPGPRSVV
ncbi:unnamed protein product [Prorocentrum cordatum]|uniref:Uncharacterized protein n=1 Tax=Prorocentrum cordatum TaxID=2364126 RepID=A0ABN9X0L8_9DINO|nr:unnamed protein product [Polarella glacialis]